MTLATLATIEARVGPADAKSPVPHERPTAKPTPWDTVSFPLPFEPGITDTGPASSSQSGTPEGILRDTRTPDLLGNGNCGIRDSEDPRFSVIEALAALRPGRMQILECRTLSASPQAAVEATIFGESFDLLELIIQDLAEADGFAVDLYPIGANLVRLTARPATGNARGARWRGIESADLSGTLRSEDTKESLRAIIGLETGSVIPAELGAKLSGLGYSTHFVPIAINELDVRVEPRPLIRTINLHHSLPLPRRDVESILSLDAQVGALARGQCATQEDANNSKTPPPICAPHDVACRQWEENETRRLESYLFDRGYLRGRASLSLGCDHQRGEATLHVWIRKGKPFKIAPSRVEVAVDQNRLPSQSLRRIERAFIPRALFVFRTPITRSFIQSAKERIRRNLADPSPGPLSSMPRGKNPFPEVEISTNYDDLNRNSTIPDTLSLNVKISLGQELQTSFASSDPRRPRLRLSEDQLVSHLKLFQRQEMPSQAVADQESANLRAYYQNRGYLLAQVSGMHASMGSLNLLRFRIFEGPRIRLGETPRQISIREVPKDVQSRIERRWAEQRSIGVLGFLSDAAAVAELGRLAELYQREGYACAKPRMRVAFWRSALNDPKVSTVVGIQDLIRTTGKESWLTSFPHAGLESLRSQDRAQVFIRFEVDPGPRLVTDDRERVRHLNEWIETADSAQNRRGETVAGEWGADRIFRGTSIEDSSTRQHGGIPITQELQASVVDQVASRYHDNGYPLAQARLGWRLVEPRSDKKSKLFDDLRQVLEQSNLCTLYVTNESVKLRPVLTVYEGKRGTFGKLTIRGNFKTRKKVIASELRFSPGQEYSARRLDETKRGIETLGVTQRVELQAYPVGCELQEPGKCEVHHVARVTESQDYLADVRYGFGSATLNPLYAFVRPSFPNLLGTAWGIELEGSYGADLAKAVPDTSICEGISCFERRVRATIARAHLPGLRVGIDLGGQYQQRYTPARGEVETISGTARLGWRLSGGWNTYFSYRYQRANISKDLVKPAASAGETWINRGRAVVRDDTGMLEAGVALSRVDNPYNPDVGYIAGIETGLASPWLGGGDWWSKIDASWQHFIALPKTNDRLNLRYSLKFGWLIPFRSLGTKTVPEIWRYYGGGSYDLGIRGILPETMLVGVEEISLPFGQKILRPRAQGGHIRVLSTVALQLTSLRDFLGGSLSHSIFYDAGILTHRWIDTRISESYRHSVGLNFLKWNINVATVSLGYAVLLGPNRSALDDRNGRLVFDVGITF